VVFGRRLQSQHGHGYIEQSDQDAEQFEFLEVDSAVGAHDVGGGGNNVLLDGQRCERQSVEGAREIGWCALAGWNERQSAQHGPEGTGPAGKRWGWVDIIRHAGQGGEQHGDVASHTVNRMVLGEAHPAGLGGRGEGMVNESLERVFEHADPGVSFHQLSQELPEDLAFLAGKELESGEGQLNEWQPRRRWQIALVRFKRLDGGNGGGRCAGFEYGELPLPYGRIGIK
jgi:hypothetical protein